MIQQTHLQNGSTNTFANDSTNTFVRRFNKYIDKRIQQIHSQDNFNRSKQINLQNNSTNKFRISARLLLRILTGKKCS